MISFLLSVLALILGYIFYGGFISRVFGPKPSRPTPAVTKADGVDFILFDLLIGNNYQPRESVERCAQSFGIGIVPIVGEGTLEEAGAFVRGNPRSTLGDIEMEGIVCRPKVELRDRGGERVICKIKWNDFKDL